MFPLNEVEQITGLSAEALKKRIQRGDLAAVKITRGKREVWALSQEAIDLLTGKSGGSSYDALVKEWKEWQASGYLTGKAIGESRIAANGYGLLKYWKKLDCPANIRDITPENFRLVMASFPIDYENRKCWYGQKEDVYKGICSFVRYLIEKGLKSPADLEQIKKHRPRRVFPPRKTVLQESQLRNLLDKACSHWTGKNETDRTLGPALIMIMAWAGLRKSEVINLGLPDVDLDNGIITVVDGKGHKTRQVGISPELDEALRMWLRVRAKIPTTSTRFFIKKTGEPITKHVIRFKLQRLAAKIPDLDITPHGLRRTFATLQENRGMPWSLMKVSLGHSDIKTTQGYIMSDERQAVEWLKGKREEEYTPPTAPTEPKAPAISTEW